MTNSPARLHYDAIAAALAAAGAQLNKASPALAALVHIAPQIIDPTASAAAQVRQGHCVFSPAFTSFAPAEAAVVLAHVALHLILGHDHRLQHFLADVPTGNARLFNTACDLAIAQLLAPLTTPPRMPLSTPAGSLTAAALEIAIAPQALDDIAAARRLGLATASDLMAATPEAIYSVLSALAPPQRAALLGAPGARPLGDDLRPATSAIDRVATGANDNLAAIARHLSAPLAQADTSGVIAALMRRLEIAPPDWRLRLRALLEAAANPPGRPTYARPDHRQASRGAKAMYLPGRAQPKRKPIVAIIDPHAAIAPRHTQAVLFELNRLRKARPSRVIVIIAGDDTRAHELSRVAATPAPPCTIRNDPTDLRPALALACSYRPETILCLTDLCITTDRRTSPAPVFLAPACRPAPLGRHIEIPIL